MVESFEGILKKEWYKEDLKALTSQIKDHDSLLRLKRRWLLDLPLSVSEQKRVNEILPPDDDKILPESLLREDDVIYEAIRTCIEMRFGAHNNGLERHCVQEDVQPYNLSDHFKDILFLLDEMTNIGLCSFIKILTGGTIKFEKTNWSMKRTVKEFLPKVLTEENDISKAKFKQLFQLLRDPQNFRGNQMVLSTASEVYLAAAVKVLDGLEDFPSRALSAMDRKLRGVKGYVPTMESTKSGKRRDSIISRVKKMSMKMLTENVHENGPGEALAGALGVACLTLKFILNRPDVRDLRKFSPEMEVLQNDIAKAIYLLNYSKRVSLIELRKVQLLLDPNTELSVRSLRMAVRNLLTEFLFECSDMGRIPDFLIETLNIINRRSQIPRCRKHSSSEFHSSQESVKDVIQKEVECVLTVSAQAKEVLLGLLPDHGFDEDFAHAYMEDFEGSDTLYLSDADDDQVEDISEHYEYHSQDSCGQTESVGETNPAELNSPVSPFLSPNGRLNVTMESMRISRMDSDETCDSVHSPSYKEAKVLDSQCTETKQYTRELGTTIQNLSSPSHSPAKYSSHNALKNEETTSCFAATQKFVFSDFPMGETNLVSQENSSGNQYLDVQEACDVTSMVAYHSVGHMLSKLAKVEGLVLYQGDRLYLQSYKSDVEDSEDTKSESPSKVEVERT